MKKSILISSTFLFLLFLSPAFSFAQEAVETEVFYAYERVNYECRVPIVKALPLPDETTESLAASERKNLVKGLRLTELEALSGNISNELNNVILKEVSSLSGKLDFQYSLPFTKINVKLSFSENGKVGRVIVDGDKLDEHLIKGLEDALYEWQFENNKIADNLTIRFELLLSAVV